MMNCKVKEQKLFSMIKLYAYIFMYVDMNIMYVNCKLNTIFDFFRKLHKTPTEDLNTGKNTKMYHCNLDIFNLSDALSSVDTEDLHL